MDVVFGALDSLVERLRRRHLTAVLGTGLIAWLAVTGIVAYVINEMTRRPYYAAMYVMPAGLMVPTAVWGLGRPAWPAWPVGVGPIVVISGIFAPMVVQGVEAELRNPLLSAVITLIGYVYAQVLSARSSPSPVARAPAGR